MTSASGSQGGSSLPTLDWTFDKAGNRTTRHANSSVDEIYSLSSAAMHQYAWVERLFSNTTFEYNAAGSIRQHLIENTTEEDFRVWKYDWRQMPVEWGRTVMLYAGGGFTRTVTYRYDALGRRIARVDDGVETRFVYDGWRVVEERDDQDNVLASYVHDGYIDDVVSMRRIEPTEGDWFFHSDDQFSVSLLTDFEGAPVERIGYDAWGAPTFQRVSDSATASVSFFGNPYAFTGRRWDATEGVYHYRLRTFDPAIGRCPPRRSLDGGGSPPATRSASGAIRSTWAMATPTRATRRGVGWIRGGWRDTSRESGSSITQLSFWEEILPTERVTRLPGRTTEECRQSAIST
jgi:hypothetical protein